MSIKRLSRLCSGCLISLLAFLSAACQATLPLTASVAAPPTWTEGFSPAPPVATPAEAQASLDRPFELAVGQEIAVAGADLHLRFERLLDDSRCPRQVECVWSGQARAAVALWRGSAAPQTKEFSTFSRPPDTTDTHIFQDFSVKLVTVTPYPETPGQPIPAGAYRLTLLVTRSQ